MLPSRLRVAVHLQKGERGEVLQFIIVGLVLGSIYALAASGLVITYVSTGVLNFAFGSLAYFIARTYYYLHIEKDWGILARPRRCASSCVAPLHGPVPLHRRSSGSCGCRRSSSRSSSPSASRWRSRRSPTSSSATVEIFLAPGLAPAAGRRLHGVRHRGDPRPGDHLRVRARHRRARRADPALHRSRPQRAGDGRLRGDDVAVGQQPVRASRPACGWSRRSWPGSSGILAAPVIGLDAGKFTLLIAAAFAAVIAARLRSLPDRGDRRAADGRRRQPRAVLPAARQRVHRQHRSRASRSRSS